MIFISILIGLLAFVIAEVLIVLFNGTAVNAPTIPRTTQTLGSGSELRYVVMGDSTSIGQGTSYNHSYARVSAEHLAADYKVRLTNVGVSGARANDVATDQLAKALQYDPDIVLIAVGANDVTHLTSTSSVRKSLQTTIDGLRKTNPDVKIVVTGTPAMGSVARFPWPLKQLAGQRTKQLNHAYDDIIAKNNLILAPIAAKTGKAFRDNPELFAPDKFHPNTAGYKLWIPVINDALDQALTQ